MANKLCPKNGNDFDIDIEAAKPADKNFTKDGKIMSYNVEHPFQKKKCEIYKGQLQTDSVEFMCVH